MATFKREKPHVRIDRIGRKLTPIERAAEALFRNRAYQAGVAFGVPDEFEAEAKHRAMIIKAVFESIDALEMADRASKALREVGLPESFGLHIAVTIKNWLTGKDQQQ